MFYKDKTIDLETIRRYPGLYMWGPVLSIIDIADTYTLVFYKERRLGFETSTGRNAWAIYLNGKDTGLGATSLDKALLLAVACGNPACKNPGEAAAYAAKILDLEPDGQWWDTGVMGEPHIL